MQPLVNVKVESDLTFPSSARAPPLIGNAPATDKIVPTLKRSFPKLITTGKTQICPGALRLTKCKEAGLKSFSVVTQRANM